MFRGAEPANPAESLDSAAPRTHGTRGTPETECARDERGEWAPADWRAWYDERSAVREYEGGMARAEAERAAWLDLAAEWVEAHPELDALPSREAGPLAFAALAALGIEGPRP